MKILLNQYVPPSHWPSSHAHAEASDTNERHENGENDDDDDDSDAVFVLSGNFVKHLALSEKRRRERKEEERAKSKLGAEVIQVTNIQSLLERRRHFESSDDLTHVLKRRQEIRDLRENMYGREGDEAITDMEDKLNETFDAMCSEMQAPIWPTPIM